MYGYWVSILVLLDRSLQFTFRWRLALIQIHYQGSDSTRLIDINNSGVIIGYYELSGEQHEFIYEDSNYINFDSPSGETILIGINDSRKIIGKVPPIFHKSFLKSGSFYSETVITDPFFGLAHMTIFKAINNAGTIVGDYYQQAGHEFEGFQYKGTDYKEYGFPCSEPNCSYTYRTTLNDVNDTGQVIGYYWVNDNGARAFVYDGLNYVELIHPDSSDNMFGGSLTSVRDINSQGVIVGNFQQDEGGMLHGFFATPIDCISI